MRVLLYLLSAVLLVLSAILVPMPLLRFSPARATPVLDAIEVAGDVDEPTGALLLTTVAVDQPTVSDAIGALFDPFEDISRREEVIPPDVDEREFFETQRDIFDESVRVAAAVGLRLAGRDVAISGRARIVEVIPGGPASGELQPGDVVVRAEGQRIALASELQAVTTAASAGEALDLVVIRDGERVEVAVEVGTIPGSDATGLGVLVETRDQRIELPRDITIEDRSNIGGPSAGLMIALTVFDLFDPADLTRGRVIAGTGTVTVTGRVGPIGGIAEKVEGARLSGADVFLAPASQAAAAQRVAPEGLEVVSVETVEDAVAALTGG